VEISLLRGASDKRWDTKNGTYVHTCEMCHAWPTSYTWGGRAAEYFRSLVGPIGVMKSVAGPSK
jgi:hypothetical protein